ncbi:hypothetical protein BGK60_10515 [Tannerella forsythia]|nr:hypothetical protein BGK60_10515 [Tannerella forsythia]
MLSAKNSRIKHIRAPIVSFLRLGNPTEEEILYIYRAYIRSLQRLFTKKSYISHKRGLLFKKEI